MTVEQTLNDILKQEKIIKSAIKAKDMDIVTRAIEIKGDLITELEKYDMKNLTVPLKEMVETILRYDEENTVLMKEFKGHVYENYNVDRKEKLDIKKKRTISKKYKNPYTDNVGGTFIDRKK